MSPRHLLAGVDLDLIARLAAEKNEIESTGMICAKTGNELARGTKTGNYPVDLQT